ncbi:MULTISPECIES: hypothetical protein [Nocardioides]|uniref:hypothetical protein n=1 Tax=Nocardioides TaxID=1839 RepID=UPI0011A1C656|nr:MULTISPECIES: hypothetical protein [Nocardioides]
MLLLLIALPVIILATLSYGLLQAYAPSNVLIRRVQSARPTIRMAVALGALAFACALSVHTLHLAIDAGAPGLLNIVVLLLAWDAIKFAILACLTSLASAVGGLRLPVGRPIRGSRHSTGRGASRSSPEKSAGADAA